MQRREMNFLINIFITTCLHSHCYTKATVLHEAIQKLNEQTTFTFVNAGLNDAELSLFESLIINDYKEYTCFGSLSVLNTEIPAFLTTLGNRNVHKVAHATTFLINLINRLVQASGAETAWVVLRASSLDDEYAIPRWHFDGYYYEPIDTQLPKFVITLQGPHTLFYPLTDSQRAICIEHSNDRSYLANFLTPNAILSPSRGIGAFFLVGDEATAALHSEPNIDQPRLFLALVFGSEQQIKEWHTWCLRKNKSLTNELYNRISFFSYFRSTFVYHIQPLYLLDQRG